MVLYLRNKNNDTVVDVEIYVKSENKNKNTNEKKDFVELRSVVVIDTYSLLLLENVDRADEIINDFQEISELRSYLWENYFMVKDNTPDELQNVIREVSRILINVGKKYDLHFVTD